MTVFFALFHTQNEAIFEAGDTFSKANHFLVSMLNFGGVTDSVVISTGQKIARPNCRIPHGLILWWVNKGN